MATESARGMFYKSHKAVWVGGQLMFPNGVPATLKRGDIIHAYDSEREEVEFHLVWYVAPLETYLLQDTVLCSILTVEAGG